MAYFCQSMPSSWQKVVYTPPICITIRLPFVSRYFCGSIRVRGRWNTPKWPSEFESATFIVRYFILPLRRLQDLEGREDGKRLRRTKRFHLLIVLMVSSEKGSEPFAVGPVQFGWPCGVAENGFAKPEFGEHFADFPRETAKHRVHQSLFSRDPGKNNSQSLIWGIGPDPASSEKRSIRAAVSQNKPGTTGLAFEPWNLQRKMLLSSFLPRCWAFVWRKTKRGRVRQRSGEGVVRRNGCPKGCFWRVRFFSAPLRFVLKNTWMVLKPLRGQISNGLSKNTLLDNHFSARRLRCSFGAPPKRQQQEGNTP